MDSDKRITSSPAKALKKVPANFYRSVGGSEPVRTWLKTQLNDEDRKTVGGDIGDVEFGWPVGMPLCKSIGDGLWEIRSDISDKRTCRMLFFVHEGGLVLLHAFIKKTEKMPPADLALAKKRKREVENG